MPHFTMIFNGNKMVRREVKRQTGGKLTAAIVADTTPAPEPIKSPEAMKEDKKTLRMKLQAELYKTL